MDKNIHQALILDVYDERADNIVNYNKKYFNELSPDYKYVYWDKNDLELMMIENFEPRVLNAFNSLKSYAFKADLARACILYVHGGFWIDMHSEIYKLPDIKESLMLFKERAFVVQTDYSINNSFFYSNSKHKYLLECIYHMCENIEKKYYGKTPWDITGPNAWGEAFYKNFSNLDNIYLGYCTDDDNGESSPTFSYLYRFQDGEKIGSSKRRDSKFLNLPGYQDYRIMWSNKDIFHE